jgi:hypothetical protein
MYKSAHHEYSIISHVIQNIDLKNLFLVPVIVEENKLKYFMHEFVPYL